MEPVLIAAYREMLSYHRCSVDRILEEPDLRIEYLGIVRRSAPERAEREILHGLNNLRKKSKLPRRDNYEAV
jgi:hypothetical protein